MIVLWGTFYRGRTMSEYVEIIGFLIIMVLTISFMLVLLFKVGLKVLSPHLVDRHMRKMASDLRVKGDADLSVVSSGLTYFGSMMGSYKGVYIELVVEKIEDKKPLSSSSYHRAGMMVRLGYLLNPPTKLYLSSVLTYNGQKRHDQFLLTKAAMNFGQVQEALLKDVEDLLLIDSNA